MASPSRVSRPSSSSYDSTLSPGAAYHTTTESKTRRGDPRRSSAHVHAPSTSSSSPSLGRTMSRPSLQPGAAPMDVQPYQRSPLRDIAPSLIINNHDDSQPRRFTATSTIMNHGTAAVPRARQSLHPIRGSLSPGAISPGAPIAIGGQRSPRVVDGNDDTQVSSLVHAMHRLSLPSSAAAIDSNDRASPNTSFRSPAPPSPLPLMRRTDQRSVRRAAIDARMLDDDDDENDNDDPASDGDNKYGALLEHACMSILTSVCIVLI